MGKLEQASTLAQSSCGRQASGNMPEESGTRGIASKIKCPVPLWKLYAVGKLTINAFLPSSPRRRGGHLNRVTLCHRGAVDSSELTNF